MVEADVALNFDPHSRTNTTNPMPTNSPILPFLVLTMAGGCGVSNLMKRTGNNSWVCVEMGNGGGQKGGRRVESRHKCPCQGQTREGELHWPQQQAQNGCQSKLQKTRRRCLCALSENHRRHSSLVVWCELMRDPSGGQGGRLDLNRLGWAGIGSRAELWGLWGRQFVIAGFDGWVEGQNCTRRVTPNLIGFWNVYLFPHVFIPRSLALFDWVGGLGLDYPRRWTRVCLFAHKDAHKARLKLAELHLGRTHKKAVFLLLSLHKYE